MADRLRQAEALVAHMDELIELGHRDRIRALLGERYIGPEAYEEILGEKCDEDAPRVPATVTPELLRQRCPIAADGRTIAETHRLVFIPDSLGQEDFFERASEAGERLQRHAMFRAGEGSSMVRVDWPFVRKWILMPIVFPRGNAQQNV